MSSDFINTGFIAIETLSIEVFSDFGPQKIDVLYGKALMNGVINKCKEMNIEKCYVNSFGWRRHFYNSVGFKTENKISFWYKIIYNLK